MRHRCLGRSGLRVSALCLGTVNFLWTADKNDSLSVLDRFWRSGGNFIDTADVYTRQGAGVGSVESLVGEWMSTRRNREEIVLATKVRGVMWNGPDGSGLSRRHVVRAVDESLTRLRTDYIDLYQAHWADVATPIEETLEVMAELIAAGKVRHFGVSNFSPWRLTEAILLGRAAGAEVVSYQARYSLVHREEFELWFRPLLEKYGIGLLAWSPLEGGFLTGKYRRGEPVPAGAGRRTQVAPLLTERNFEVLDVVREIAAARALSPAEVSLAWLLARSAPTVPVVSANSVAQLAEVVAAVDVRLHEDELHRLEQVSRWQPPDRWQEGH